MSSQIFIGKVMHTRLRPVEHAFQYPLYWYSFDLDSLEQLERQVPLFGYNRIRPVAIHDRDYLDDRPGSIREKLLAYLEQAGCSEGITRIVLVTAARFMNYVFNPVSFYYCYDSAGNVRCTVAEVNNTFHERHLYILDSSGKPLKGFESRYTVPKAFHVSPFNDMQGDYDFHFSPLNEHLDIRINILRDGEQVFLSRLWGKARPLTTASLVRLLLRYPLHAALSVPRIYWQAARLHYQRKLPVFPKPHPVSDWTICVAGPTWWERFCMSRVLPFMQRISRGRLEAVFPDGRTEIYGTDTSHPLVSMRLKNYGIFPRLVRVGGMGLGESYVDGEWETDDPASVVAFFLNNSHVIPEDKLNWLKPGRLLSHFGHRTRKNTLKGSVRNIQEHYDLSNDFFQLFLDESLTYSCAVYSPEHSTLEGAQKQKVTQILNKAQIQPGETLLEIGSGWGTLALEAASKYQCLVTSISLSQEQLRLARQRADEAQLSDKVHFQFSDYRAVQGQYDKIVSVEMLEAVGAEYLGEFFASIERLLKPNGIAVIQVIAFPDHQYDEYLTRQDWIQKYVFPGSHLPSLSALLKAMRNHSSLVVENLENIGPHYARTLREWRERFQEKSAEARKLGFDERFQRIWNYYLASCEAEFQTRWLTVYQIVLTRPNNQTLIENDRHVTEWGNSEGVLQLSDARAKHGRGSR